MRPTTPPPKRRCRILLWNGQRCRQPATPVSPHCPTHQFLLESEHPTGFYDAAFDPDQRAELRAAGHLSLIDELTLIRLHIRRMLEQDAPSTAVLNALRTLSMLARLQTRLEKLPATP